MRAEDAGRTITQEQRRFRDLWLSSPRRALSKGPRGTRFETRQCHELCRSLQGLRYPEARREAAMRFSGRRPRRLTRRADAAGGASRLGGQLETDSRTSSSRSEGSIRPRSRQAELERAQLDEERRRAEPRSSGTPAPAPIASSRAFVCSQGLDGGLIARSRCRRGAAGGSSPGPRGVGPGVDAPPRGAWRGVTAQGRVGAALPEAIECPTRPWRAPPLAVIAGLARRF